MAAPDPHGQNIDVEQVVAGLEEHVRQQRRLVWGAEAAGCPCSRGAAG